MAWHFLVLERLIAVRATKIAGFGGQYNKIEVVRAKMPELFRLRDHRCTQGSYIKSRERRHSVGQMLCLRDLKVACTVHGARMLRLDQ